jgi:hypothetical protein
MGECIKAVFEVMMPSERIAGRAGTAVPENVQPSFGRGTCNPEKFSPGAVIGVM